MRFLADIGGTQTRIVYAQGDIVCETRFPTAHLTSTQDLVTQARYLYTSSQLTVPIEQVYVCAAGPLVGDTITLTNSDLTISASLLSELMHTEAFVMNDMEACAHHIASMLPLTEHKNAERELIMLGGRDQGATMQRTLITNIGTGLGVSLIAQQRIQLILPSESHALPFTPYDETSAYFSAYLSRQGYAPITWELLLSGRGIEEYYAFTAHARLPAQEISIRSDADMAAKETIRFFVRSHARFLTQAAMIFLPYHGIVVCGNIATQNAYEYLTILEDEYRKAAGKMLDQIPLALLKEYHVPIKGLMKVNR